MDDLLVRQPRLSDDQRAFLTRTIALNEKLADGKTVAENIASLAAVIGENSTP